ADPARPSGTKRCQPRTHCRSSRDARDDCGACHSGRVRAGAPGRRGLILQPSEPGNMMPHQFNRTILREYDVRGIVGQTLNPEDAYALGRSYAALAASEGAKRVAVGRDGRTHSPALEAALVDGLTQGG